MKGYSERYEAALTLAAQAHYHQVRKGINVPYIVHPVHVSAILLRYGFPEDVVIAGLLHDVVEDQNLPIAQIEAQFGPAVAKIVAALTEQKREGDVERPWEVRKEEKLEQLQHGNPEAVAVKAADVLHNVHSLQAGLRHEGSILWSSFKGSPGRLLRYYRNVAEMVRQRLGAHPLADELEEAIHDLEKTLEAMRVPH